MKQLIIIGSGPAGLSAAIYAKRAAMDVLVLEKESFCGGQIINAGQIDNYLGLNGLKGYEIASVFHKHAEAAGVEILTAGVSRIRADGSCREVILDDGRILKAQNIIIATGAAHRKLGVSGEDELTGRGVSYCAVCDGNFFRNKAVAVIGGGNTAVGDALYLSDLCSTVYLINRREQLRASKSLVNNLKKKDNIIFLHDYTVKEIIGNEAVEEIVLNKRESCEDKRISISGVFVAIGMKPETGLAEGVVKLDKSGYIIAGEDCRTGVCGVYAAGDVRTRISYQLITAAADGANVIHSIETDNNYNDAGLSFKA